MKHSDSKPVAVSSARAQLSSLAGVAAPAVASGILAAANLVEFAARVGDTAQATTLAALMGGQSPTGGELAIPARVSPPPRSFKLAAARLVAVTKKRRLQFCLIASPSVAKMLEGIEAVAAIEFRRARHAIRLRFARACYGHVAGHSASPRRCLTANRRIVLHAEVSELTETGHKVLVRLGADLLPASRGGRSERRDHLATTAARSSRIANAARS